jgi:hypothetical protein
MPKGLEKEFGSILGKKEAASSGAASDLLAAIKSNDAGALKSAFKLMLEECGYTTKDDEEHDEDEDDDEED